MIDPEEIDSIWCEAFDQGYNKAIHFVANNISKHEDKRTQAILKVLIQDMKDFGEGL